ncbi:hypothetical protein MES4922_560001 [Mesorhizobium ventifaucium]|uniref:Uncharacterized protein n=1 Tax=Mesorhizobium ventifaucium TaxID=666020 RepID=A0ABM9EDF3_9HYPH|nr:hypothetical protein MES4922_560001 [Mesorhizobium ventifaucium]
MLSRRRTVPLIANLSYLAAMMVTVLRDLPALIAKAASPEAPAAAAKFRPIALAGGPPHQGHRWRCRR